MKIKGRVPLRLGLAGGGTDLNEVFEKYGGVVINGTINKYIHATIELSDKNSVNGETPDAFTQLILDRANVTNVKIITWCEVPWGRGLGSSSAYSILLMKLISELQEINLSDKELVEQVYGIESCLGKCGWQDQYAAAKGGFNWMEFGKEKIIYPLRIDNINNFEQKLCLVYSGITHVSSMVQSSKPLMTEEQAKELKELAYDTRDILLSNDTNGFGSILNKGWEIKKNSATTTEEINDLYELGIECGAIGGKVCGAGKGGYILFCVEPKNMPIFREEISVNHEILDFNFTNKGVEIWKG